MHLRGACSNPQASLRVEAANRALLRVQPRQRACSAPARPVLRLQMGAIQEAVGAALALAAAPMSRHEVHAAVERLLGRRVSQDTVGSFLSVAARRASIPIERVGPGLYAARKLTAACAPHLIVEYALALRDLSRVGDARPELMQGGSAGSAPRTPSRRASRGWSEPRSRENRREQAELSRSLSANSRRESGTPPDDCVSSITQVDAVGRRCRNRARIGLRWRQMSIALRAGAAGLPRLWR